MKKLLFILLLFMASNQLQAQIAVKFLRFCPTSDQGVVFEKRFTAEIMYMQKFEESDKKFRSRFGLSYVPLKTRLDSIPSYAVREDGNGTTVLPGYEIYHKYNMGFIFCGYDWAFVNKKQFAIFIGMDVMIGGVNMEYERYYETYVDESFSGGQLMGGLRFRAGAQYAITDHFNLFADLSKSYYGIEENGIQSHYDYGFGVQYNIYK